MARKSCRQKHLEETVFPYLEEWVRWRRDNPLNQLWYPAITIEGKAAEQHDAAFVTGSGLQLEAANEKAEAMEAAFVDMTELGRQVITEKWLRTTTDKDRARRCGFESRRAYQHELHRQYDWLAGRFSRLPV